MGLFCKELLTPASVQLPVLGKRLWLLQGEESHAGHANIMWPLFPVVEADQLGTVGLTGGRACPGLQLSLPPWKGLYPLRPCNQHRALFSEIQIPVRASSWGCVIKENEDSRSRPKTTSK